jgi:hypothetical protein
MREFFGGLSLATMAGEFDDPPRALSLEQRMSREPDVSPAKSSTVVAWAIPAALIIATEYAAALAVGARVGFRYTLPWDAYLIAGLTVVCLTGVVLIVVRLGFYAVQREEHPTRRLVREAPRFYGFAAGVVLVGLQAAVLTWAKVMLPLAIPFWADPMLANVDRALFGQDPWILAHRVFGWAAPFIDQVYISWAPAKFGTLLIVLVLPESHKKSKILVAYFLLFAMIVFGQYAFSSAGPIFYAEFGFGNRFQHIPIEHWVGTARSYLMHDHAKVGGDPGGGISAWPSFHVAGALWTAQVWYAWDRRFGALGLLWFAIILIGSVLLGWHYAVDSIAGVLMALGAWAVAPKIINRGWGTFARDRMRAA